MTDKTKERMKQTFYTINALLWQLDNAEEQGQETYENKGQLIKTAGQLLDEIGEESILKDFDPEEWWGQFDGESE